MTDTRISPAPWSVEAHKQIIEGDEFTCVAIHHAPAGSYRGTVAQLQSAEHIVGMGAGEVMANARLIAAAPDMAEALEELLEVSRRAVRLSLDHPDFKLYAMEPMDRAVEAASAALAKARGAAMTHTATRDWMIISDGMHTFAHGEVRYTYTITAGRKAITWANATGHCIPAEMPDVVVSDIHIRLAPGKDWTPVDGWLWELLREVPDAWFIEQLAEADDA